MCTKFHGARTTRNIFNFGGTVFTDDQRKKKIMTSERQNGHFSKFHKNRTRSNFPTGFFAGCLVEHCKGRVKISDQSVNNKGPKMDLENWPKWLLDVAG